MPEASDHVFVGGTGRSGTTVVGRLVGAHERYHLIPFEARFQTILPRVVMRKVAFEEFSNVYRAKSLTRCALWRREAWPWLRSESSSPR